MRNRIAIIMLSVFTPAGFAFGYEEKVIEEGEHGPSYVYFPDKIDKSKTYWVVAGIHQAKGKAKRAGGIDKWADKKDNVIVVSPQYVTGFQNAFPEHQEKLVRIIRKVKKDYDIKLHPRIFLYGFSGGSQFAHRFAMKRPELVCGVSAHSGGSWATRGYSKINPKARHIPFAISCGEKDTSRAWNKAPLNRLDWFNEFRKKMKEGGFCFKAKTWPNIGHRDCKGVWQITEECFALATTGALPGCEYVEKLPEESGWNDNKLASKVRKKRADELKQESKSK